MIKGKKKVPNPGSLESVEMGCLCSWLENDYGRGLPDFKGGRIFTYNPNCPVHIDELKKLKNYSLS